MTNKNLKGFSIARWVQEDSVILTDSNTYIGDDGTIIADGAVGGSSLVLINPDDGSQLNLLSASRQEGAISSLVFPNKLGIKNQHLRLKNAPSLDESIMYLEWADTMLGTVTSVAVATKSKGLVISDDPITSDGTINIDLNDELQALSQITDNGLIVRTDNGYKKRAITIGNDNLMITDGDAIADNPKITLNSKILNLDSIETKTLISSEALKTKSLEISNDNKTVTLVNSAEQSDDNIIFTMPSDIGADGQYLKTDGKGKLNWGTITADSGGIVVEGQAPTAGVKMLNGINGVTINTTAVKGNSIILVTRNIGINTLSAISTIGNLVVGEIKANESFKVYSTVDGDMGQFNWLIINA